MLLKEIIFIYETQYQKSRVFVVALYYCDVGTELLNNV